MEETGTEWPEWLVQQRSKKRGEASYLSRSKLVRRWAKELVTEGREVTHAAIREMLEYVDRGYSMKPDQISAALQVLYRLGTVPKMPNGKPVRIDAQEYQSARAAAEELGISPQTVLNRINSDDPKWANWKHAERGIGGAD